MILSTAALCLAINIYFESRSEPIEGQYAVAQVTMNRAERDPKKLCKVVFKPNQFSWANPLTSVSKEERVLVAKKYVFSDTKAWDMAKNVAQNTLLGYVKDFTGGATFYHTRNVRPIWRYELKYLTTIGNHKFYKLA